MGSLASPGSSCHSERSEESAFPPARQEEIPRRPSGLLGMTSKAGSNAGEVALFEDLAGLGSVGRAHQPLLLHHVDQAGGAARAAAQAPPPKGRRTLAPLP